MTGSMRYGPRTTFIGSREIGYGVIHVEIVWSVLGMICSLMMFSEVVGKKFLSLVSIYNELFHAIKPKVSLFHGSWELVLESVIYNSSDYGIIPENSCGCLVVSHFFKNEIDDFSIFDIDKKSTKFYISSWGNNKSEECWKNMDWLFQFYWLLVLGKPS